MGRQNLKPRKGAKTPSRLNHMVTVTGLSWNRNIKPGYVFDILIVYFVLIFSSLVGSCRGWCCSRSNSGRASRNNRGRFNWGGSVLLPPRHWAGSTRSLGIRVLPTTIFLTSSHSLQNRTPPTLPTASEDLRYLSLISRL